MHKEALASIKKRTLRSNLHGMASRDGSWVGTPESPRQGSCILSAGANGFVHFDCSKWPRWNLPRRA